MGCNNRYDECPSDFKGSSPPVKFVIELFPYRRRSDEEVCKYLEMRHVIRGNRGSGFIFDPFHNAHGFSAVAGITRTDEIEVSKFMERWEMLRLYKVPKCR